MKVFSSPKIACQVAMLRSQNSSHLSNTRTVLMNDGISTSISRKLTFTDLDIILNHRANGNGFLKVDGLPLMAVNENDLNSIYSKTIDKSDVLGNPKEVFTYRIHKVSNDRSKIETLDSEVFISGGNVSIDGPIILTELERFLKKYSQENKLKDIYAVEFIHSHPYFDVLFSDGDIHRGHLNNVDFENGAKILTAGLIILTAVVPNGYRYSSVLQMMDGKAKDVTEHLLE